MLNAEITNLISTLDEGDRAELAGLLIDSLEAADPNDSDEDSLAEAIRRGEELDSGKVQALTEDEFWQGVREDRRK
jgi:hypothetical protein